MQGDFMREMGLDNNNHRNRRIRQPATYVKTGIWYLNQEALDTQFGLFCFLLSSQGTWSSFEFFTYGALVY